MTEFQRTQQEVDTVLDTRRTGSVYLVLGWIVLGVAALLAIFVFNAIRDGDSMWLWFTGILGVVGLALVARGAYVRSRSE